MPPASLFLAILLWLAPMAGLAGKLQAAPQPQDQQDSKKPEKKPDTFFAGTIVETTAEKLVVSRVVLGKTEKREFRITPDTKCDAKLKAKMRVTVRYVTDENGDIAAEILVRPQNNKKKQM